MPSRRNPAFSISVDGFPMLDRAKFPLVANKLKGNERRWECGKHRLSAVSDDRKN
jgi:hypothetical protein